MLKQVNSSFIHVHSPEVLRVGCLCACFQKEIAAVSTPKFFVYFSSIYFEYSSLNGPPLRGGGVPQKGESLICSLFVRFG